MVAAVDSAVWSYSSDETNYISYRNSININGMSVVPTITGSNPTKKYTSTLSGYGNPGYKGPRYFRLTIFTSTCTYIHNILITDTKGTTPGPPIALGPTTICSGSSIALTLGTLASGTTVQWQSSADSSSWTNVGNTTANYTASPAATRFYRAQFNGGTGSCGINSKGIRITVVSAMSANTVSPAATCSDGASAITLTGTVITGGNFQWQKSITSSSAGFSNIIGATAQNYTVPSNVVSTTTWYRRIASNSACNIDTSTAVVVYPPVSNNQITNSVISFCGSASATVLTGSAPAGGNGIYAYQWESSTNGITFSNIPGATSINYTTPVTVTTTYYQRVVASGGCSGASNIFAITVNANPSVTATANTTVCSGTPVTLTASGANIYTWSPSTELSASTGTSVVATPTASRTYTITGTSSNGCTGTATTTLTVTALPSNPTLSNSSQTICSGSVSLPSKVTSGGTTNWYTAPEANASYLVPSPSAVSAAETYYAFGVSGGCYSPGNASFTLTIADVAAPAVSGTSLTYCSPATADLIALQPLPASGTSLEWHTVSSSPSAGNLVGTPSSVGNGTYYLFAYSSEGACFGSASSAVNVTINPTPVASTSSASVAACSPSTINLNSYNNTSGTNTYNWYNSSVPSLAAYVQNPAAISESGRYYLIATSLQGCTSAPSSGLEATIHTVPATGISAPDAACGASSRTINAATDAVSPSYQWQISSNNGSTWSTMSNAGLYSGVTTSAMTIANTNGLGGTYYRFTVTDNNGCSAISNPAVLTEDITPVISANPSSRVAYAGNSAIFSVTETSPTADYQWMVSSDDGSNFINLTEGVDYMGVNTPTLTAKNVDVNQDNYLYKVVVSNTCTNVSSTAARLNVSAELPVTWVSFTARKNERETVLDWKTASEKNARNYLVQRSYSGTDWTTIGSVNASGYSNSITNYSFTDGDPGIGINYYRLKQIDYDGKYYLSKIASVEFNTTERAVSLSPNPVTNGILNIQGAAMQFLMLINMQGQIVLQKQIDTEFESIDVSYLPKGFYKAKTESDAISVMIQ
jgi:hypothetical protein